MASTEIRAVVSPRPTPVLPANILRWAVLTSIFAAGALLRFRYLAVKPLWFDECFSVGVAWLNWRDFALVLWKREANMSLYYAMLRGWLHFGGSVFFIRSLSVIAALAALPAIHWLGRLLFDRRVAIIATALLAFNAYSIRYAQEARSYAWLILLCTWSRAFFVSAIKTPSRWVLRGYVILSVLGVYAHFYALLLIAAQWMAFRLLGAQNTAQVTIHDSQPAAIRADPELARKLWGAWRSIAILVLPILVFVAKTGAGPIRWIHRPGLRDVLEYYQHMAGNHGWGLLVLFMTACAFAVAPYGQTLLARGLNTSWETWRSQFLLIWLIFPVALTVVLSYARPLFYGRYVSFCLPAFILLASAGIARLSSVWTRSVVLAAALILSLQGTAGYYRHDFDIERDAIGEASYFILEQARAGDALVFHIAATRAAYEVFAALQTPAGAAAEPAALAAPEIVFPRHGGRLEYRDFTGNPPEELMRATAAGHARTWVVLMHNGAAPAFDSGTRTINQVFGAPALAQQRWEFPDVEVRLYSRK